MSLKYIFCHTLCGGDCSMLTSTCWSVKGEPNLIHCLRESILLKCHSLWLNFTDNMYLAFHSKCVVLASVADN